MSDIFDTLITNRPDINTYYNISDLNRVEEAVKQLAQRMTNEGYYVTPKAKTLTAIAEIVDPKAPEKPPVDLEKKIIEPYIESSGTQYIDTGFKHNQNTRVVMHVKPTSVTSNAWLFEGRASQGSSMSKGIFFFYSSDKKWNVDYTTTRSAFSGISATDELFIDYNKNVCTINGVSVTNTAKTFQSTSNLVLLADNSGGTISGYIKAKLYSCKIYDNGTLIRDYVPAVDQNNVACLYDKVESKYYYNKGSGAFTYGENVYKVVEYIRGTGTQYIKTGVIPTNHIKLEVKVDTANGHFFSGVTGGSGRCGLYALTNGNIDVGFGTGYFGGVATGVSYPATIVLQNGSLIVNDKNYSFTSQSAFTSPAPLSLFAEGADTASGTLYYSKIYLANELVRDFVPVIDSYNVGLLYDTLNGVPYYNAGSGKFTNGQVVTEEEPPEDNPEDDYIIPEIDIDPYIWNVYDIPTDKETERYINNLLVIRRQFAKKELPLPETMQGFNYNDANNIEVLLVVIDNLIKEMITQYRRCNTFRCGERW